MGPIMMSCQTVARLLTSGETEYASVWRRWQIRFHVSMCGYCSRLARQVHALARVARAATTSHTTPIDPELEERLLRRLDIHP